MERECNKKSKELIKRLNKKNNNKKQLLARGDLGEEASIKEKSLYSQISQAMVKKHTTLM